MNLARTSIADSLAAVEADLGGTQSGAVVVLVTDGEETYDGNPEEVITALRDKGIPVNLNIVGFAIEDAELAAQFDARTGLGGRARAGRLSRRGQHRRAPDLKPCRNSGRK